MNKLDELHRQHRLIDERPTGLHRAVLITEHGFSRSTLTRLIADLRDNLGAPIICTPDCGGYRYDTASVPIIWNLLEDDSYSVLTGENKKTRGKPRVLDSVHPRRDNLIAATALTPESYN